MLKGGKSDGVAAEASHQPVVPSSRPLSAFMPCPHTHLSPKKKKYTVGSLKETLIDEDATAPVRRSDLKDPGAQRVKNPVQCPSKAAERIDVKTTADLD